MLRNTLVVPEASAPRGRNVNALISVVCATALEQSKAQVVAAATIGRRSEDSGREGKDDALACDRIESMAAPGGRGTSVCRRDEQRRACALVQDSGGFPASSWTRA